MKNNEPPYSVKFLLAIAAGLLAALIFVLIWTANSLPATLWAAHSNVTGQAAAALPPVSSSPSQPSESQTPSPPPSQTPTPLPSPSETPPATETSTSSPTSSPTPTHTPTLPPPTRTPGHLPLPDITQTPTLTGSTPIPTPSGPITVPEGTLLIAVLGSDQRPDWNDWHTDVIQIVAVQPDVPAVTVLSIPRDLYVYVPDMWMSRINFADMYGELYGHEGGGPGLVRDTLQYNLGFRPDYYVRTNFDGLIGIVDTLGGIDVPVHCRLEDYWPYPDENGEYHMIALEPGVHHLDGEMALWYSRSRKTTSVFSRERRQQQVLQAIWRQARQQNLLPRLPELWSVAQGMVQTDMDFSTVASLAAVAFQLQEPAVRFRSISYAEVTPWTTPLGGNVFLPNWEKIQPVLDEALGPVPTSRLPNIAPRIEVWNGSHYPDYDRLAADRLYRAGFAAAVGTADHSNYERSQIVVFGDTTKGLGLAWLQNKFNVSVDRVIYAPDPNAPYPVRLIVGADYQPCDPNF